jgi:hypothetical protein
VNNVVQRKSEGVQDVPLNRPRRRRTGYAAASNTSNDIIDNVSGLEHNFIPLPCGSLLRG